MNDIIIYLLKVSAGLAIIFLPYYFLFRNDPNLEAKRFYLLLGMICAWIFPLITFRRPELLVNFSPIVFIDPDGGGALPVNFTNSGSKSGLTINWIQVLIYVYLTGMVFMLLKNIFIILKLNFTWRKSKGMNGIAFTESDQVFTIFSKIFIPRKLQDQQDLDNVLLHEKAHVQQLHFIDLTMMELTLLLTWFNPFSWLISRMIKENHEHLADRQVLSAGINPAHYRAQLLNHTLGVNVFRLGNQFNHSLTLKRFKMMKKPTKSPMGIIRIALLIPAVMVTLGLTIGMTPQEKSVKGKIILADTGEPARGAAVLIKGSTVGTISDENGEFILIVENDPEIVISFVGYANLSIKSSKITNKPLKLNTEVFEVDPESAPISTKKDGEDGISIRITDDSDAQPVYVLDGKVVKDIDDLDPNNIESIEVIKDSDSEIFKKYKATAGVILITSKNGVKTTAAQDEKVMLTPKEVKALSADDETDLGGDEVFYIVEDMPMFPGGTEALKTYIYSHLEYPASAKEKSISGEVMVQFLVTTSGKLEKIKVARSTYQGFDKPALDVFNDMPDWNPGKQRGKPVQVQVVVPVRFNADKK
jgi:TonB family protein